MIFMNVPLLKATRSGRAKMKPCSALASGDDVVGHIELHAWPFVQQVSISQIGMVPDGLALQCRYVPLLRRLNGTPKGSKSLLASKC